MMHCIIGIDIGTTHTKSVLASAKDGSVIAEFKKTYAAHQPVPGWHEQDPREICSAVKEVLALAAEEGAKRGQVICVSFSAAMHSLVAVDEGNEPLTPLMTWADTRSIVQADHLKSTPLGATLYRETGVPVHPMTPLCKIAWLRSEQPAIFSRASKFISIKEYVFAELFGEYVVDYSIAAASGLFDMERLQWHDGALSFAGISEEQLSKPVLPFHRLKGLAPKYRDEFALSHTTSYIAGASDGALATIGSGALMPGEAALTIGTSGALRLLTGKRAVDDQQRLFYYAFDGADYLVGGAINNGGNILQWFMDTFADVAEPFEAVLNRYSEEAKHIAPGSQGLIFLPYLHGERAPIWDASASGAFIGIRSHHTKAHFLRAILEGISFSLLQIQEALEETGTSIDTICASGGFIESTLWLEILCDILGKPVNLSRQADASAMGAIYAGMYAMGAINGWNEIKKLVRTDEVWKPDASKRMLYLDNYKYYSSLYRRLKI